MERGANSLTRVTRVKEETAKKHRAGKGGGRYCRTDPGLDWSVWRVEGEKRLGKNDNRDHLTRVTPLRALLGPEAAPQGAVSCERRVRAAGVFLEALSLPAPAARVPPEGAELSSPLKLGACWPGTRALKGEGSRAGPLGRIQNGKGRYFCC